MEEKSMIARFFFILGVKFQGKKYFCKNLRKMIVIFLICVVFCNLTVEAFQAKCLHKVP